jgi:predicted  nucleic acid-binding Zn-ribbon protein
LNLKKRRSSLKEQLNLLWELQKIDLEIRTIVDSQEVYPRELKRLDERQRIEKEKIQKEKEKIELLEKERRQKEGHLSLEQEKIKKTEGRMFEVKTNKEYQAFLSEIETLKGIHSREEEEILQLLEEIDELRENHSKREKEIATTLGKIEGEKKGLQEKMAHDQGVLKRQMERKEAITKQLEAKLYKLYNTLKEKRKGVGVVSVKHETCQGCFVHVPPQMFIEVQKNNALIRCPNCNRILYWEGNGDAK